MHLVARQRRPAGQPVAAATCCWHHLPLPLLSLTTSVHPFACPPQPVQPNRSRDRFISLPDELQGEPGAAGVPPLEQGATPTIFEVRSAGCRVVLPA